MHTFYLEGSAAVGEIALLPKEEAQHARKVLRLTAGDEVCLLDGQGGRYAGKIVEVGESVSAELIEALPDNESNIHLTVWQGVPKADKAEWIVQKLTELGVSDFELLNMTRCVVKGNEKDGLKKQERLNRIARAAGKQRRRGTVPVVGTPVSPKQAARELNIRKFFSESWRSVMILLNKKRTVINTIRSINDGIILTTRNEDNVELSRYGSKKVLKIAQLHHDHRFDKKLVRDFKNRYGNVDIFALLTPQLVEEVAEMMKGRNRHTRLVYMPNFLEHYPTVNLNAEREKTVVAAGRLTEVKRFDLLIK
ncbi:MAG: RsmE family RNA methyltransferase, partial [Clostridia bacterium]|nr:RsmE family RNA methyltransferase [Clostridia bacterium]